MASTPLVPIRSEQSDGCALLPGVILILSPPRSGSTLLRVMLAGHPALFAPPELHLLGFGSMAERQERLPEELQQGLTQTLMTLMDADKEHSAVLIAQMVEQSLTIEQVYGQLQEPLGDRRLVDKSPSYAKNWSALQQAEQIFTDAQYIHLTRHPYAAIQSFVQADLVALANKEQPDPYPVAEKIWVKSHRNALALADQLPPERYHRIRYEDLVRHPAATMEQLCQFLHLPFVTDLLQPYEGQRMQQGDHSAEALGDPNFLTHHTIDAKLADAWRTIQLPYRLGAKAQQLANQLNYSLPQEQAKSSSTDLPVF
ncbi:MAG: sulfotransferase [Leptolyngbyaceae cyanobacterium]